MTVGILHDPHVRCMDLCGPGLGPAVRCDHQPLLAAITGDGLRRHAGTAAERDLLARLEFTAFQRGTRTLYSCRHASSLASTHLVRNAVGSVGLGISEGVVLGGEDVNVAAWARDIAASNGSGILRLATAREGELPDEAASRIEDLNGGRHWTMTRVRMKLREVLRLAPGYEDTLAGLGRHTRRNVRNARKLAAAERITFSFQDGNFQAGNFQAVSSEADGRQAHGAFVPDGLLRTLARQTVPHPVHTRRIRVFEAYADQTGQPFRSALRTADGQVISYCCGFLGQSAAYLVYQLNDRRWNGIGPSLMHRAFLIEELAQRSCRELVFVHGCSGVLRHSCVPMVADHYWVMRRTPAARLRAAVLANFLPNHLLGKVARAALQTT